MTDGEFVKEMIHNFTSCLYDNLGDYFSLEGLFFKPEAILEKVDSCSDMMMPYEFKANRTREPKYYA